MNGTSNGKTVSSENKKKGHFNIIDVILILIIVVLIAVIIYIFSPISWIKNFTQKQEKVIHYTVEFTNVDEAFINSIKEGDVVVDAISKNTVGKVESIEKGSYVEYDWVLNEEDVNGEKVSTYKPEAVDYPNKYNIVVTIAVGADYVEDKGYSVDSTRIAVGELMYLRFPGYADDGYCIGIN